MADSNETEATAEYYIVRIYRRRRGRNCEPSTLRGVVEDTEGNRRTFGDCGELWGALVQKLEAEEKK